MRVQKGRSRYIALAGLAVLLLLVGSASAAKVNYIYDELSRLIRVEYPDGTVIKYDYDKLGNRTYTEMLKNPFTLTVEKTGIGSGIAPVVYSLTPGIDCGNFCTGAFSGGANVTLKVSQDSDYELTGWSGGGCSGAGDCTVAMDGNKTVTASFALLPPVADFTASPTIVNETPVSFTDASLRATSWYWEFGDGFTSTEQNPTHVYAITGTYTVSLTITNSASGLTSTKIRENYITVTALSCNMPTQPVQIDKPAVSYFSTLQDAYAAAADGAVIKVHALTLPGDLIANDDKSITLIGGYQCDYSEVIGTTPILGSITIENGMLAIRNIDIIAGTSQIRYHQIHASSDAGGSISPSGAVSVAHGGSATYSIIPDQNYQIADVLVDDVSVGAVDTYQFQGVTASHVIEAKFLNVWLLPVADFTASPRTVGELTFAPVSFTDNSVRATSWSWDFGDGEKSTDQYPIHTYSTVGTYTVSLTVTNATGTSTKRLENYITVLPYENFPVQIDKPSVMYFSSLQAAYNAAADGAIIKTVAATLLGDLNANENKSVTLVGGFQNDYSQQTGTTALLGSVTTSYGVLDIKDIEMITGISQYRQISASSDTGGSISPAGMVVIAQGGNATFTILPDQDHLLVDVLVDGVSVGAVDTYTFINVSANHTIEAKFAWKEYTISVYAGTGGTISPSGVANTVSVPYKSIQDFTITPDPGYHIVDVSVDGNTIGAVTSYTFSDIMSDHFIEATFSNRYTLNVLKTGNGSGSVTSDPAGIDCGASCLSSLVSGSTMTLTAAPQSNSLFGGWSGDGCSGTDPCVVTINSDIVVNAIFNLIPPPIAYFSGTPTTGIRPVTANFYDLSTGSPTSWFWDFGDSLSSSNTSTLKNPSHTYSAPGKYTITLTSTNAGGSNTLTITDFVVVHPYVIVKKIDSSTAAYRSIQEAYNAAQDGETIQVLSSQALTNQGRELVEDLVANATTPKTVTLEGGYDINLDGEFVWSATGMTTMKGSITTNTSSGTLTLKNVVLQK